MRTPRATSTQPFFNKTAVEGYDTVDYVEQKRPIKGKGEFEAEYNGANWYFSSTENLALFKENPEKYATHYGGYGAYAMAKGQLAVGKAKQWRVVDSKLYLNYSSTIKKQWDAKHNKYIRTADSHWQKGDY